MIILKVILIILLFVVFICIWKSMEYFETLSEFNKGKPVLAWDIVLLSFFAVDLILRMITM